MASFTRYLGWFWLGVGLAVVGVPYTTWEYWAIAVPVVALISISEALDQ